MIKIAQKIAKSHLAAYMARYSTFQFIIGKGARRGQSAVEYLLTTVALVTFFASMYGFLQGQVKKLFLLAGTKILTSYQ